jgi:hypothetical protein
MGVINQMTVLPLEFVYGIVAVVNMRVELVNLNETEMKEMCDCV